MENGEKADAVSEKFYWEKSELANKSFKFK